MIKTSNQKYEERRKHIFRKHTSRHKPQTSIAPRVVSEEARTDSIPTKSRKKTKTKIRVEDTGTVRTDRFLF